MLYDIPTPILVFALLAGMIATVEGGIRIGRRYGQKAWTRAKDIHTALTAASLALMGLMLAFTFSLSASRYEMRKTVVVSESAAIQAVHNTLDFLAPEPRAQGKQLLHYYTGRRIAYIKVGYDRPAEAQAVQQSRALFSELWRLASNSGNYAATEPQLRAAQYAELTGTLLDLNRLAREREAARDRTVPQPVIGLLFALAIGAGAVLSYMSGATGHPDRLPTYAVLILVCLIIYVIIDFDRPHRGLMRFDAAPLQKVFSG